MKFLSVIASLIAQSELFSMINEFDVCWNRKVSPIDERYACYCVLILTADDFVSVFHLASLL